MTADKFIFIFMIFLALFIVSSRNYKRIIIALGAFSLLASFCYLLYHAPDVAIAEAVIGSALSTILFIVALKKHRTFYIYFTGGSRQVQSDSKLRAETKDVASKIMGYLDNHDLEAQAVYTWEPPGKIANEHLYDLILHSENDRITLYGSNTELHVQAIKELLQADFNEDRLAFVNVQSEDAL